MNCCKLVLRSLCVIFVLGFVLGYVCQPGHSQEQILSFNGSSTSTPALSLTVDEKRKRLFCGYLDKCVRVFDSSDFRLLKTLRFEAGVGNQGEISCLALSDDGRRLAVGVTGSADFAARIYLVDTADWQVFQVVTPQKETIFGLSFLKSGSWLASLSEDRTLLFWDIDGNKLVKHLQLESAGLAIRFVNNDSNFVLAHESGSISVFQTGTFKRVKKFKAHDERITGLVTTDSDIFTASIDGKIKKWSQAGTLLSSGAPESGTPISFLSLANDGGQIFYATGRAGSKNKLMGQVGSGGKDFSKSSYKVHAGFVSTDSLVKNNAFDWQQTALLTATQTDDGRWISSDVENNLLATGKNNQLKIVVASTSDLLYETRFRHERDYQSVIEWSAIYDPDSSKIIPQRWFDISTFRFRDLNLPKQPLEDKSQGGHRVILATDAYRDQQWQLPKYREERQVNSEPDLLLKYRGPTNQDYESEFFLIPQSRYGRVDRIFTTAPNESWVATGKGIFIFNPNTGAELRKLSQQSEGVIGMSRSADNRFMLAYGSDRVINFFNTNTHQLVFSLFVAGQEWVAWTPQGYYDCSAGGERLVGWHVNRGAKKLADFQPLDTFYKKFYKPELMKLLWKTASVNKAKAQLGLGDAGEVKEYFAPHVEWSIADDFATEFDEIPGAEFVTREPELTVKLEVTTPPNTEISEIWVRQNGSDKTAINAGKSGTDFSDEVTITLDPGVQEISFRVASAKGSSQLSDPIRIFHRSNDTVPPGRKLHVLSFGIDEYQSAGDFTTLGNSVGDAKRIRELLIQGAQGLYADAEANDNVTPASRNDVFAEIDRVKEDLQPNDTVVLYWSGHGHEIDGQDFYFVTPDCSKENVARNGVSAGALGNEFVSDAFDGVRIVVMIDTCFSGLGGEMIGDVVRKNARSDRREIMMLASSRSAQKSGSDLFGKIVIDGLDGHKDTVMRDAKSRDIVVLHKLFRFVRSEIEQASAQQTTWDNGITAELYHQLSVAENGWQDD